MRFRGFGVLGFRVSGLAACEVLKVRIVGSEILRSRVLVSEVTVISKEELLPVQKSREQSVFNSCKCLGGHFFLRYVTPLQLLLFFKFAEPYEPPTPI